MSMRRQIHPSYPNLCMLNNDNHKRLIHFKSYGISLPTSKQPRDFVAFVCVTQLIYNKPTLYCMLCVIVLISRNLISGGN